VLLDAVASEKEASALLASSQPTFPDGLMILAVYAALDEFSLINLGEAWPVIVSHQPGWVQEKSGDAAAPFVWRVTLFIRGTSSYNYTLSFDCAPPSEASAADQASFEASCKRIWAKILSGVQVMKKEPCVAVPILTPGPVTWRQVSDKWYKYAFEVPSAWYEERGPSSDRLLFFNDPALLEQFSACPPSGDLMKLDFGADPIASFEPDLTGMEPVTVANRPAWITSGEGGEAAPATFMVAVYISGLEYGYSLWLGCTPFRIGAESNAALITECRSIIDHILASFQIAP
jgi:hypothetical protein